METKYCVRYHLGRVKIDPDAEYYKSTEIIVMVPVKVFYHDATDTVYDFDLPTRATIEKAFRQTQNKG